MVNTISSACHLGSFPSFCTISWYQSPFFFGSHHGFWKHAQRPTLRHPQSKVPALEQLSCIHVLHSPSDDIMYKTWGVYFGAMESDLYSAIFGNCNHLPTGRPPGCIDYHLPTRRPTGCIGYHLPTGRPPGCTIKQHPPPGRPPGCSSQIPVRIILLSQQSISFCASYISNFGFWGAMQDRNLSLVMMLCHCINRSWCQWILCLYSLWGVQWILHLYSLWGVQSFTPTSKRGDFVLRTKLLVRYLDFYFHALWGVSNQVANLMIISQHETARYGDFVLRTKLLVRYLDFHFHALWGVINQIANLMITSQHETARSVLFSSKSSINGESSLRLLHVELLSTTENFLQSFQNFVQKWGAPQRLLADSARYQSSNRVLDYLCMLWIGLW